MQLCQGYPCFLKMAPTYPPISMYTKQGILVTFGFSTTVPTSTMLCQSEYIFLSFWKNWRKYKSIVFRCIANNNPRHFWLNLCFKFKVHHCPFLCSHLMFLQYSVLDTCRFSLKTCALMSWNLKPVFKGLQCIHFSLPNILGLNHTNRMSVLWN